MVQNRKKFKIFNFADFHFLGVFEAGEHDFARYFAKILSLICIFHLCRVVARVPAPCHIFATPRPKCEMELRIVFYGLDYPKKSENQEILKIFDHVVPPMVFKFFGLHVAITFEIPYLRAPGVVYSYSARREESIGI
jgi:hypothetical protein